jgi:lysophospholipase L1-like esterase
MTNNNTEGYSAKEIAQIATYVAQSGSLAERPNLVLILAGANDMNLNDTTSQAPERLGALIDEVQAACPDAAIIVSELTPIANNVTGPLVQIFNAAVPAIVAARSHVLAINMSAFVPETDLADGLHPSDSGYQLMAEAWLTGIQAAGEKGWIGAPVKVNSTVTTFTKPAATKISIASSTSTSTKASGASSIEASLGSMFLLGVGYVLLMVGM